MESGNIKNFELISVVAIGREFWKIYTGCNRRNGPNFGRMFLMLNYIDITQNTYVQS